MFDRKQTKTLAKKSLKRNYITLVFICLLAAFFGISGESDLTMLSAGANSEQEQRSAGEQTNILYEFSRGNIGILVDGKNIITDQLDDAQKTFEKNKSRSFKLGSVEFSFAEGEFAKIANMFVSGSYVTTVYKAVCNITGSSTAAIIIMIVISLVLRLMIVFFVLNVFEVIMASCSLNREHTKSCLSKAGFSLSEASAGSVRHLCLSSEVCTKHCGHLRSSAE